MVSLCKAKNWLISIRYLHKILNQWIKSISSIKQCELQAKIAVTRHRFLERRWVSKRRSNLHHLDLVCLVVLIQIWSRRTAARWAQISYCKRARICNKTRQSCAYRRKVVAIGKTIWRIIICQPHRAIAFSRKIQPWRHLKTNSYHRVAIHLVKILRPPIALKTFFCQRSIVWVHRSSPKKVAAISMANLRFHRDLTNKLPHQCSNSLQINI